MMRSLIKVLVALALMAPAPAPGKTIKLPELDGSGMVIPWQDFKKLLELIQPKETEVEDPPPPAAHLITAADYQGRLAGESAVFDFTIKVSVLEQKEWVLVPVLPRELALEQVKINDGPVLIVTRDHFHQVALKGAGDYTLTGRFYAPAGNRRGPRSVSAPLVPTPVTTLGFIVPEPGLELRAEPANLNRVILEDQQSRLEAVLPPSSSVTITWSKKIETEEARLRVNADIESLVILGERLCQVSSVIHYQLLHRGVTEFKLNLPREAEVIEVSGIGIADWKTQKLRDGQILTVSLSFEVKANYELTVLYELGLPDATAEVQVPVIATRDTARETGHLGVAAGTNLEIKVKEFESLAYVDVSELPRGLHDRSDSPIIHAFKYVSAPWSLKLKTIKHREVEVLTCTVDALSLLSFMTKDGEVVTRALYTIRNNREQFIRIILPSGARVFSTFRDGRPIQPARDEQGRLLVPLEKSAGASGLARAFTIEVTYLVQGDRLGDKKGRFRLEAPQSDLMTNSLDWKLILPKGYEYEVIEKETSLTARELAYRPVEKKLRALAEEKIQQESKAPAPSKPESAIGVAGAQTQEYRAPSDARFDQANLVRTQGSPVKIALPVRFLVPTQGAEMAFHKAIIQEHEPNNIAIKFKKVREPLAEWQRNGIIVAATVLLIVLLWLAVKRRSKKRRAGREATP